MTIKAPVLTHRGKEVKRMKYHDGKWWYKGKAFDTLREALLSVWPR